MKSLGHLRVLDLTRVLAGPWCTQLLADLGAEVIKIERPGSGDDTRAWGPPYLKDSAGADTSEAAYYLSANRGKRSVTIDISTAEGQSLLHKLAEHCDIVVENYMVGQLAKYKLDYASLATINPKLDLLLDHRLRPNRAASHARRLRLHHAGHRRLHVDHRRAR